MVLTLIIAFISLIGLIILHEFGHFVLAKKFKVKVEEFGIGYPPRLFGKKIGETIYSLNLLPFGAFVRIYGEEKSIDDPKSFTTKPFWQKTLIILGGVISFWIISAILLTVVMGLGAPTPVEDEENHNLINPKVQIVAIALATPAEKAGLEIGDTIASLKLKIPEGEQAPYGAGKNEKPAPYRNEVSGAGLKITKVKEVQEFTEKYRGEEIVLTIARGKEVLDVTLVPRVSHPENEGPMGVALVRTALKSYPWYLAPIKGIMATGDLTITVLEGWLQALARAIKRQPTGVQLMGPVGIFDLFTQVSQLGVNYFLQFVAVISIYIALFNILPIPVVDGGKLLFIISEKIRGKPINQKIVQNINIFFFVLLITLMIWVTIKDVARLF